jgi:hypothetical protein
LLRPSSAITNNSSFRLPFPPPPQFIGGGARQFIGDLGGYDPESLAYDILLMGRLIKTFMVFVDERQGTAKAPLKHALSLQGVLYPFCVSGGRKGRPVHFAFNK